MKIAFLGTPEFSLPILQRLIDRKDQITVFTQPDRPVGRKAVLTPPPVKVLALAYGIPVLQFERIRSAEGIAALKSFEPDLMVTAAFGQLLSADNLAIPKHGTINVHGSLLPKYRGASPIQTAILNGDSFTGVTTMFTDIGMDTGDIILAKQTDIGLNETYGELSSRLSQIGADLLIETLRHFENGTLVRIPQNEDDASVCHMIKKTDGMLHFNLPRLAVHNRIRAMNPWPGAYAFLNGETFKIWESRVSNTDISVMPGYLCCSDSHLFVGCSDGPLEITSVQIPGKKRMDVSSFLNGCSLDGKVLS